MLFSPLGTRQTISQHNDAQSTRASALSDTVAERCVRLGSFSQHSSPLKGDSHPVFSILQKRKLRQRKSGQPFSMGHRWKPTAIPAGSEPGMSLSR